MSPLSPEERVKKSLEHVGERIQADHTTRLHRLDDYWSETVKIELNRITVLTIVGAGILALKHPDFTGPSSMILRHTLGQLIALVCEYVPRETLEEWDHVLGTMFCS